MLAAQRREGRSADLPGRGIAAFRCCPLQPGTAGAAFDAGLSLVEAIETLAEKESRPERASCDSAAARCGCSRAGRSRRPLERSPEHFPPLYVATVRASERTGDLPEALSRFVAYQTQLDVVRKKVVSASIYPAILIGVGGLVTLFLLGYVVPRFSHVYEDMGGDIPLALAPADAMGPHGRSPRCPGRRCSSSAGSCSLGWWLTQASTRARIVRALRRIPAMGERVRIYQLTRFYRTLGMLLTGGIPIVAGARAWSRACSTSNCAPVSTARNARIREGKPMSAGHGSERAHHAGGRCACCGWASAPAAWAR